MQMLISISKQLHGHFMQTDGSRQTDMCRWQLDFDILIRLSLQWLVLQQGTGRFSKMTSTMLMWYSENCFEAWSAHLLPQTGHDLGMKSCMIGMHGLHNLFNNIQYSVKCWSVRCVEMHWNLAQYAANLPPDHWLSRILMWTCRGHHTGRPRNPWDTT